MIDVKECFSVVRNKTFAIKDELKPVEKDNVSLKLYDDTFSRFVFTLIGENKSYVYGNVPIREIPEVFARTKYAKEQAYNREGEVNSSTQKGPAYDVRLTAGKYKGKSPAEILQCSDGEEFLNNHYKWLRENLEKYPNNKTIMDAIMAASKLKNSGKLEQIKNTSNTFNILDIQNRPLVRKQDNKGNCFVYEIKVNWMYDNRYPVCVELINFYAPVIKTNTGLYNVEKKSAVNVKKETMYLSGSEWECCCEAIKRSQRIFENTYGSQILISALKEAEKARTQAQ